MSEDVSLQMGASFRRRVRYAALTIVTIGIGLTVHLAGHSLPPRLRDVAGDALWASMITWLLATVAPATGLLGRAVIALAVCAGVECSQLYRAPAIDAARRTTLGHLVLGSDFDRRDLLSYAGGVLGATVLDIGIRSRRPRSAPARHAGRT